MIEGWWWLLAVFASSGTFGATSVGGSPGGTSGTTRERIRVPANRRLEVDEQQAYEDYDSDYEGEQEERAKRQEDDPYAPPKIKVNMDVGAPIPHIIFRDASRFMNDTSQTINETAGVLNESIESIANAVLSMTHTAEDALSEAATLLFMLKIGIPPMFFLFLLWFFLAFAAFLVGPVRTYRLERARLKNGTAGKEVVVPPPVAPPLAQPKRTVPTSPNSDGNGGNSEGKENAPVQLKRKKSGSIVPPKIVLPKEPTTQNITPLATSSLGHISPARTPSNKTASKKPSKKGKRQHSKKKKKPKEVEDFEMTDDFNIIDV